ncbi:MAG: hypothetical protein RR382_02435 [Tannerellaceae bacterium]
MEELSKCNQAFVVKAIRLVKGDKVTLYEYKEDISAKRVTRRKRIERWYTQVREYDCTEFDIIAFYPTYKIKNLLRSYEQLDKSMGVRLYKRDTTE